MRDSIVVHAGRRTIRERLRRDGEGLTWIFESDGALVVATQLARVRSAAGIGHGCRGATAGAAIDLGKTSRTLLAIDARTASSPGSPRQRGTPRLRSSAPTRRRVDGHPARPLGITVRRLADGALARTVDIGSIGALDIVRCGLIARGADRLTVDAMFAWE